MSSGDLLLYVLSARGDISWPVYKSAFDVLAGKEQLKYENVSLARALTVRNLDALAFCDFLGGSSDRKIFSVPTHLVRLPSITPTAILTGARTISTFEIVARICRDLNIHVSTTEQEGELAHLCPSKIELITDSDTDFLKFADRAGIPFSPTPASWGLSHTSGNLDEMISTLSWQEIPELQWPRMDFDPDRYYFRAIPNEQRKKVRLTRYKDPKRGTVRYYAWDGSLVTQIDPDWGRYFVLKKMGNTAMYFDQEMHVLAFPKTVRLPRLLGRAVSLCSGLLPKLLPPMVSTNHSECAAYESVPRPVADTIAAKLGQQLQLRDFRSLLKEWNP
jgi:hypothetical protein